MSKLHRSRLDTSFGTRRSGSSQLASDETLLRTACPGTEFHCKPTRSVDQLCEMCPSPTLRSSAHCSDDARVDTVIGFSAGGSETNATPERQRLHSENGEGHDCRSRGTEASKEEGSTTTNEYNTMNNSGAASSATTSSGTPVHRNLDATNTSCLSDNSWLAPLCREHPSDGTDQSTTGKCSDDGSGLVKNLSGLLARKLQRSASLVNAVFNNKVSLCCVDRCGFVEICCSDTPCLTEAMQQCGISSSSLLRSDGVGNHDAQTREKLHGWFSQKRPLKASFSPPVIAHQNISTR